MQTKKLPFKKHVRNLLLSFSLAALASIPAEAAAIVGSFSGGDSGEGLDMQGNFTYAVNVGINGPPPGKVGDAFFTADNVAGVTVLAANNIGAGGWIMPNYGDTSNDDNLEFVMRSIRWSPAPSVPIVRLAVEQGVRYKLQLLFSENNCCRGRAFDVLIEGQLEADEFNPAGVQGDVLEAAGAVITYEFTAADALLEIRLDGNTVETPEFADHNPIINAFTLERLTAPGDTDADGLPDDWEQRNFGNLAETGAGDPDSDGLNNTAELAAGSSPNDDDSDNDTLLDGAEVNTHRTNPALADSDGDRLGDAVEVNQYQTDPTKTDSDGDGANDYDELSLMTVPTSSQSKPQNTLLGAFSGGDEGEGLDLGGNFVYALAVGADTPVQVQDAAFVPVIDVEVPGVTLEAANHAPDWVNPPPNYGDTANDDSLELALDSIRWSNFNHPTTPSVTLTLDNLTAGARYKMQLLFVEACCAGRAFDVYIDGPLRVNDFNPSVYQGGTARNRGAVITHTFTARSTKAVIVLDGRGLTFPGYNDRNSIINGATLELLNAGADSDSDGLPDGWETDWFGNLDQTGSADPDGDTISNATELADGTNPVKADTDADGLNDNVEKSGTTSAFNADTDFDTLLDGPEIATHKSDPTKGDTDGDRLGDAEEVNTHTTDPAKADTDGDGYPDRVELFSNTNPKVASSNPRRTMVSWFTGGDPGEGLDLQGNFVYALDVVPDGTPLGAAGDANFTEDTVEGVTMQAAFSVGVGAWGTSTYGDSPADDVLELVMQSIRYDTLPGVRTRLTGLSPGSAYKLQLLFYEQCCPRGFDVKVNGAVIADEFAPYSIHGGIGNASEGAVVTHNFIATSEAIDIHMDGTGITTAAHSDHNPILNGLTLELVAANADSDGDSLSDPWEVEQFGNLAQTGTGDPDGDGLNNSGEYQLGSDPNQADADGDSLNDNQEKTAGTNPNAGDSDADGLMDGAELNTHSTNPVVADTDGDGLRDGPEVVNYQTNPTRSDSDNDGFSDSIEVFSGTNPNEAGSRPTALVVQPFTGADAGEGLDLQGTFVYAVDVVAPSGVPPGQIGDATFTESDVEGVTVTAINSIGVGGWGASSYGDSAGDDVLELIMQSIQWSPNPSPVTVDLANLVPGKRYKLQLLFYEQCCSRAFDVVVEGETIADEFAPFVIHGGTGNASRGAVLSYEFTAADNVLNVMLDGIPVTTEAYTDHNPTLNAFTLEDLGNVQPETRLSFSRNGTQVIITWTGGGTLETCPVVTGGTWTSTNDGDGSYTMTASEGAVFCRVKK